MLSWASRLSSRGSLGDHPLEKQVYFKLKYQKKMIIEKDYENTNACLPVKQVLRYIEKKQKQGKAR